MKKTIEFIKKHYKAVTISICMLITLEIVFKLLRNEIMQKDIIGYNLISTYLISDFATPIAKFITWFGSVVGLLSLTILFLVLIKNKFIGWLMVINISMAAILNQALKFIIQRPRPVEYRLVEEKGFSFPSGHSMASTAFYGFLIYLIYKKVKNKYLKIGLITFLTLLIFSIGVSRIYLGVHYTSDVLAGFCISISYLIIFTTYAKEYLKD